MLHAIIDQYAKPYRPYMGRFINHLPMVQLALFKMTGDEDAVKKYSVYFADHFSVDRLKSTYPAVDGIDACIGQRELYEPCLDHINAAIVSQGVVAMVEHVLGNCAPGMSSGLFHTLIRLGFALQGYQLEPESTGEVARSLAYYLTAYREAKPFTRQVDAAAFPRAVNNLAGLAPVQKIIQSKLSLGQTLKALYESDGYLQAGAVIMGSQTDKVRGLLDYLIPLFNRSHDIVVLHCITGLHALFMLKDYFKDIENALDILTACITTHVLAARPQARFNLKVDASGYSWAELLEKGSVSQDVHTIKLTYSCHELEKIYRDDGLKTVVLNKIG